MISPEQEKRWSDEWTRNKRCAMEALYKAFFPYLRASSFRILQDVELAEDMVQEVMMRLWQLDNLSHIDRLGPYLHRAVINRSLNKRRESVRFADEDALLVVPAPPEGNRGEDDARLQERLQRALGRLPERCRLVFLFSRYEHLSNKEIADLLEISVKTVENQMTKALRMLREDLGL